MQVVIIPTAHRVTPQLLRSREVQGGVPVGLPAAAGPGADRPDSPVVPHLQTRTGRPVPCTGWERGSGTQWEVMNGTRERFIHLIKKT